MNYSKIKNKEKMRDEIQDKLQDFLKKKSVQVLKPNKARGAKAPGLACAWYSQQMVGTPEEIEKRKKSAASWKARKKKWKKENKEKIKKWKNKRRERRTGKTNDQR